MKQRDLIKKLENAGFVFERHGGNHDIYRKGTDIEKIPRHKEVNDEKSKIFHKRIYSFCKYCA